MAATLRIKSYDKASRPTTIARYGLASVAEASGSRPGIGGPINMEIYKPDTLTYAGAFVLKGRELDRVLASSGYIKGDTAYYFLRDHQGSVRQVICGADGSVVQENQYYPYGALHGESSALALASANGASASPYKYGGKEHISFANAHLLDFTARTYDPAILSFHQPDPCQEKFYPLSPWLYCAADPVNHVDPTGMVVIADQQSQDLIINGLTPEEAEYVRFDENGVIDTELLQNCNSNSESFLSLTTLATSNLYYICSVEDYDREGRPFNDDRSDGEFSRGVTELPGAIVKPSPDHNIYIKVGKNLSLRQQTITFAHEAYGHAKIYDDTRLAIMASHHWVSIPDISFGYVKGCGWGKVFSTTRTDTNTILINQINSVEKEATRNFEYRNSNH